MGAVADYLQEKYLYEQINLIDESISSWIKSVNPNNLLDKFKSMVNKKDSSSLESFLKGVPTTDFRTLYTIASKANENFSTAFDVMKKEFGSRMPNLKGTKLDLFSLIFGITIITKPNLKKSAKETVDGLIKQFKKAGVKNVGTEAAAGVTLIILSGALVAAAFATISMVPLMFALAVVGLALIVLMG